MIELNNWATQAVAKLTDGRKAVKGQKETVMAGAVMETLKDFCLQDEEFAQAVVQGGTFAECMAAVAKGVGSSISDIDAYAKAVAFYFPGAKIRVQMTIDLIGDAAQPEPVTPEPMSAGITLSLLDF
jgi:hypothetical protein